MKEFEPAQLWPDLRVPMQELSRMESVDEVKTRLLKGISEAATEAELETARLAAFGRKSGEIRQRLGELGKLSPRSAGESLRNSMP